jgi:hypothetical protein
VGYVVTGLMIGESLKLTVSPEDTEVVVPAKVIDTKISLSFYRTHEREV